MRAIEEDVVSNVKAYRENSDSQTARRNFIRSECAYIEGSLWLFKKLVRSHIEGHGIFVDGEVKLYLFDFDFKVTKSGKIERKEKRLPTIDNLKAFFKNCAVIYAYEEGLGSNGWNDLRKTFTVRDRLMHPSARKSVVVLESEMETGIRGHKWFESERTKLLRSIEDYEQ